MLIGLIYLVSLTQNLQAQVIFDPPTERQEFEALYVQESEINLDGKLDEDVWQNAVPYDSFIMKRPLQLVPSTEKTIVRVLWDDTYLYLGGIIFDSQANESGFVATNINRDFNFRDGDVFGVAIDGLLDRRNATVYQVNPYGAMRDLQSYDDRGFNRDWNALWYAETSRTDSAWIAEIAIPWESLRYKKGSDRVGVIFVRNNRRLNEENTLPAVPRTFTPYRMSYAGDIVGINPPDPDLNIQLNPYALGRVDQFDDQDGELTDAIGEFGGELKWAINSNSVLDLTVNTDFAQADIDQQVVNLNRFNVRFPERRQFFLENSDLFNVSGTEFFQPFFSRRIGLGDEGAVPLKAGARLVRRGADWNAGALLISQDQNQSFDGSQFAVLRYQKNFGPFNQLGFMTTYRFDNLRSDGIYRDQPADSYSFSSINNWSFNVDGFVRFNQVFSLQSFASMTLDTETGQDYAARTSFRMETNTAEGGLNLNYVGRNYNPRIGFLGTDNFINVNPDLFLDIRPKWLPEGWRRIRPGISYELLIDATTQRQQQAFLNLNVLRFELDSATDFGIGIGYEWQTLLPDDNFAPLNVPIAAGNYTMRTFGIDFDRDDTKTVGYDLGVEYGDYYDGTRISAGAELAYQFQPFVRIGFGYEHNNIQSLGVNEEDLTTDLYRGRLQLAINPRLNLNAFYQYNSFSRNDNVNIRLSWEYRPLSFLFIVINENGFPDELDRDVRHFQRQAIAKITLLRQF